MDNELQPQQPVEETKTLEEISGIKSQISETASPSPETEIPGMEMPGMATESPRSRAEVYSKLTRIFVPVIIAVVIIGAGTAIYKLFLTSSDSSDTTEPTSESGTEAGMGAGTESETPNEELNNAIEKALEEGIKSGEEAASDENPPTLSPEDEVAPEPDDEAAADETQPKIPQIKPKK